MAHPWHHSISSSRKFQGQPEDYLDIHSWFDQTKSCFADFRHRALRHHTEGIELCVQLFGHSLTNSSLLQVNVGDVGRQHVQEDCGKIVTCQDWFSNMAEPSWFNPTQISQDEVISRLEKHYRIPIEVSTPLVGWFYSPEQFIEGNLWYALRSHAEGIFLAESVFGKVLYPSNQISNSVQPTRFIAEQIVKLQLGRIPSAQDWLKHIKPAAWMVTTAKIEKTLH